MVMTKLQKLLCLLLSVLLMLQAPLLSFAEDLPDGNETTGEAETAEEEFEVPDELWVGHPTITKGDFFTEMFGNDTADIDVRALIHGYNLVNWDQNQGVYVLDPTVIQDDMTTVFEDEYGNRTYALMLQDDLYYSDGTPITAWDYAFSMLLMMSPEVEEIGGKIYRAQHLLGYDEYITGRRMKMSGQEIPADEQLMYSVLTGVQVHSDHELWITLDHDFLPYFFEIGLLMCVPYPIQVIAPGCKVYDDGFGVYIGNEDPTVTEDLYTADLLRKTILDPETGYNTHPSVVSGPYTITSWDGVTGHFVINPYFKGAWFHNTLPGGYESMPVSYVQVLDEEGNPVKYHDEDLYLVKPTIEKIAFTEADNDTLIQKLADGELHLVNKVTYGPTILDGMQNGGEHGIQYQNYPRIGLSFLTFTYDWPTVHDMKVRQAIAWCMDRQKLTDEYCQGFGTVVNGYFGIEQWEYLLVTGKIDFPVNLIEPETTQYTDNNVPDEEEDKTKRFKNLYARDEKEYEMYVAAWEALVEEWKDTLVEYTVDLDKANALLNDAKWTLNRNGETYRPGEDDVRCKMVDDQLVALDLKMMYPEGNHMAEFMMEEDGFVDNLAKVGIKLELVPAPMEDLLHSYYRETPRTTDMIYLATNFHVIVDPSITYSTDTTLNHKIWNNTYSDDEDLYYRAVNMRKTEPGDVFEYVSKWISFQERYNEVLPCIPIYSNIYFDFFNEHLQNYYVTSQVTWSQAILPAYFGLAPAVEEEEEEDGATFFDDF